jgi:hypothetical protein
LLLGTYNICHLLGKYFSFRLEPNDLLLGTYNICHLLGKYFSFRLEPNDLLFGTYNICHLLGKYFSFRLEPNDLLFGTYNICHLLGKYFSFRLESNYISQKTYPRLSIIASDWLKLSKILSETTNENDLLDSINNMCEVLYINSPFCLELAKTWTILSL